MTPTDLDGVRQGVLDRMEREQRNIRLAVIGAATIEAALLVTALLIVDWTDRTQTIVVIMAVLTYTVIALGLFALGAHVSRTVARVLLAIEPGAPR